MKRFIQLLSILGSTVVFGVALANAQSNKKLTANIPFAFSVGQQRFDAGTYDLSISTNMTGAAFVTLINEKGSRIETVLGRLNSSSSEIRSSLVFERTRGERALSGIAMAGSGITVPVRRNRKLILTTTGALERVTMPIASVN